MLNTGGTQTRSFYRRIGTLPIFLLVRYCDPFAFEVPSLKDYFDSIGIPSTYVEYDYAQGALAPLRTRADAFLETIS